MDHRIPRGVKGFTLIELLAVMAIVAVLAGIISVAVSGSGETSRDTQTVQDGTTIETSAADFFGEQTGADLVETLTHAVNQIHPFTDSVTATEVTSTLWPENFLTTEYSTEFAINGNNTNVNDITIVEEDGTTITVKTLLDDFTAINFTDLETGNFLTIVPDSVTSKTTVTLDSADVDFNDFLWLFEKGTVSSSSGSVSSRNVAIYKLLTLETVTITGDDEVDNEEVELTYLRIF